MLNYYQVYPKIWKKSVKNYNRKKWTLSYEVKDNDSIIESSLEENTVSGRQEMTSELRFGGQF